MKKKDLTPRFGIGEWFGFNVAQISGEQRRALALKTLEPKKQRSPQLCPFQALKSDAVCTKEGGVCSLRLYGFAEHSTGRAMGVPLEVEARAMRATCPYRFHEDLTVFQWVGRTILGDDKPILVTEVGFLESTMGLKLTEGDDSSDDVGRLDMVLASFDGNRMNWAALEIQGVYFSGNAMRGEFEAFADENVDWVIFPAGRRRPDYRSSGPKRLMPQLQIKVPTLRRWGKKMAVVVDAAFFESIGEMDDVSDISNADIAWFVVDFEEVPGQERAKLVCKEVRYTTLERSVEGLTGGKPVSLPVFEQRIAEKIQKRNLLKP